MVMPSFPAATHGDPRTVQNPLQPYETIRNAIDGLTVQEPDHMYYIDEVVGSQTWISEPTAGNEPLKHTITSKGVNLRHPDNWRPYTVRELACLQGFPRDYEFIGGLTRKKQPNDGLTEKKRQFGNAVPPTMAKALLDEIIPSLRQADGLE